MNKLFLAIFFLILLFFTLSCKENKSEERIFFDIEIRNFNAEGYWLTYVLNQDSIYIRYNCDFDNCKDKILYKNEISYWHKKNINDYLNESSIDTLKNSYFREGLHGTNLRVKISFNEIKGKKIKLIRYNHPVIEGLMKEIDKTIEPKKYKYHSEQNE